MKILTINVPDQWIKLLDYLVSQDAAASRCELIRAILRDYIKDYLRLNKFFEEIEIPDVHLQRGGAPPICVEDLGLDEFGRPHIYLERL